MSAAENKELIRNMFAELSKGNAQGFLDKFADNCRFTIIGTSKFSGTWNSKQEFVAKVLGPLGALLEGGITITPDNFIAEGDYVAMQARGKSNTKAGGTYNNTYCQVFKLANGKIVEMTEYLDTELVASAFGR
ncbi:MAG TPA: nuclear transport factor 2 family protein [Candidatus Binataceae bacterium]|jgi:ketosteroid isomerase-like protein|nr:nuclear transport factor 2 family protein [Candidatus Binataceae bacterium]